jgi:hypothetical protein
VKVSLVFLDALGWISIVVGGVRCVSSGLRVVVEPLRGSPSPAGVGPKKDTIDRLRTT